jgi:hypothetical protein
MRGQVRWQSMAKGVMTFVPFFKRWSNSKAGSYVGARYFYSVWLRHLVSVASIRPGFSFEVVAELGPGDALGIGICALLSGSKQYVGLDQIPFGLNSDNFLLLDELTSLFKNRTPIPNDDEMPGVFPKLDDYSFPHYVLSDEVLKVSLSEARVDQLRSVLSSGKFGGGGLISYAAPWSSSDVLASATVDFLLSQAVLEHVDDIDEAYQAMRLWLKPSGMMSHRIDYTSHGITRDWFGHWTLPPWEWNLIRGKREYLINRKPHSAHLNSLTTKKFNILGCITTHAKQKAPVEEMLIDYTNADLNIAGAYIVAELGES